MNEINKLISTIKTQLKLQRKTYRDVALILGLSEQSIKRLLTSDRLTVDRLIQISHMLGFSLAELAQEAADKAAMLKTLSLSQEEELVSDQNLLLIAVCVLNNWTVEDILTSYKLSGAECIKYLTRLDRFGFIDLLPGNRMRLKISKDFDWIPNGPIKQFFKQKLLPDFLSGEFNSPSEPLSFSNGMLTQSAMENIQIEIQHLREKFTELHYKSLSSPLEKRYGTGFLIAMREWEPFQFEKIKKQKQS